MNAAPIHGVYLFGSPARGDADERSDIDVLAVVRSGSGTSTTENVLALVPAHLRGRPPTIAWYGAGRIAEMFRQGHLFAWHLFYEGIPLYERDSFLQTLGSPTPYQDGWADIEAFRSILRASAGVRVMASRSNGIRLITYRVPGFHGLFSQNANIPPRRNERQM